LLCSLIFDIFLLANSCLQLRYFQQEKQGKGIVMNLIECLSEIKDFRRQAGLRYELTSMLLITIMSIISGKTAYREIAAFTRANKKLFKRFFKSKTKKLPSHVTFREVIKGIDFEEVLVPFHKWSQEYVTIDADEFLAVDGKVLGSTVSDYSTSYQNFVSLVSIFSHKRGQVIKVSKLENKKESEIPTVKELIKILGLKNVTFTLDALHCQKKL